MDQEETIKKLKQMIALNQFIIIHQPEDKNGNRQLNDEIKAMNFAINYIEKQKSEIEKKDKQIERYINMLATNDMLHILECEKKDKTIYEMASYIAQLDIEEDICNKTGKKDCDKRALGKCESCIIEYYTKLAEGEKKDGRE